jgi:DnaK suppressor protein
MSFVISEAEVETGEAERDEVEIAAIERTLKRIEDGSYGVCVQCGVDIPPARLKAQPLAARCVPCQSAREKAKRR